jgi:hypothetical protein
MVRPSQSPFTMPAAPGTRANNRVKPFEVARSLADQGSASTGMFWHVPELGQTIMHRYHALTVVDVNGWPEVEVGQHTSKNVIKPSAWNKGANCAATNLTAELAAFRMASHGETVEFLCTFQEANAVLRP